MGRGYGFFLSLGLWLFLVPVWPVVWFGDFPEALFFSLGLFLEVDEFLFVDVVEAFVGVGVAAGEEGFVEHGVIGQVNISQEAAVFAAGVFIGFQDDLDLFVQGEFFCKGGGFGAKDHLSPLGVSGLGGIDAPEADASGGVFPVGDVDVEGVTVNDTHDGEGLMVIACVIGGLGAGY